MDWSHLDINMYGISRHVEKYPEIQGDILRENSRVQVHTTAREILRPELDKKLLSHLMCDDDEDRLL